MAPAAAALLALPILLLLLAAGARSEVAVGACAEDSGAARATAREKVREMFYHGYRSYKRYGLPRDELRSLSCTGADTFGGVAVTLIDSLDALAVFGDWEEFVWAVRYVEEAVPSFGISANVSVFETNIRVLGALVSAHGLLTDAAPAAGWDPEDFYPGYDGGLLRLAVDLGDRLLPAFDTPTGIPFGTVGLDVGVQPDETVIASTAAAGGLLVEMGTLSAITGDSRYYDAAFGALEGLFRRTAWTGLVGNHIDTTTGVWVAHESGIGALIDSYYEYMVKGYVLFGDERLMDMFWDGYNAVKRHIQKRPWYLPVDMFSGQVSSLGHCSLGAFWPGMQVLIGEMNEAIETTRAHFSVWRRYGCVPEAYHVYSQRPVDGAVNYPLRPEVLESVFYLHWATNDSSWIGVALSMMHSLETLTRVPCGYARIHDVSSHAQEDLQASFVTWKDSFLLSETLKYMYLVFDDSHWLRSGRWVFSTEAHPILISGKTFPWLEKLKTKGLSATGPSRRPLSSARPKRKCPRRSSIASRSSCGFGMPGTDHPTLDLGAIQNEPVEDDVRQRVRERIAFGELQLGDVFFGSKRAYRVVRFVNSEVMLANLNADETSAARRHALEVRLGAVYARVSQHVAAAHAAEFVDRSPSIPVPRLLTATREWEMLDKCESVSPMPEFGGGQLEEQSRSENDSDKAA